MKPTYTLNGTNLASLTGGKVGVSEFAGGFDALERKTNQLYESPSQHGTLIRNTDIRYNYRRLTLNIWADAAFGHTGQEVAKALRALFNADKPSRLVRTMGTDVAVWDVYYDSLTIADIISETFRSGTLTMIEPLPVKNVYKAIAYSASITTAAATEGETQHPVTIGWGDGTYEENLRAGTHSHTYTDSASEHYITVAGVLEKISITTSLTLKYATLQ